MGLLKKHILAETLPEAAKKMKKKAKIHYQKTRMTITTSKKSVQTK